DQENGLIVENKKFRDLGLDPITLSNGLMEEVRDIARRYEDRCDRSKIICTSLWTKEQHIDKQGRIMKNL
ncbi:MAG: NAD-dependent dehydratase, partial [Proteobacteria bacterium]|nr:NAD-dependent dehydratase [Pseudomonadota bacterium]